MDEKENNRESAVYLYYHLPASSNLFSGCISPTRKRKRLQSIVHDAYHPEMTFDLGGCIPLFRMFYFKKQRTYSFSAQGKQAKVDTQTC